MALLDVKNLSISFGGLRAVDNFNLEIQQGELYGLIGPNGAGKTTVFNLLTGVYKPTEGRIFLDGEDITGKKTIDINKAGIARTFQNIRLFKEQTVLDNVKIGLHNRYKYSTIEGILRLPGYFRTEKKMNEEAMRLLEVFDLADAAGILSCNLPYGKQRKLEIARALATNPKLLLLDEPAAGMNPNETQELMNTIHFVRDEFKMTILLIEHDMKLVSGICAQETVEKDWNGQILLSQTQVLSVPSEEWEETDLQGENNPNEVRQNEIPQGDVPQNETQQSNTNPKEGQGEENAEEMIQDVMAFVPHQQMLYMDLSRLGDYETLLDTFYTVDPSTTVSGSQLNIDKFLEHDFSISKDGEGPQILIFHTHSKEAFADSEPGDRTTSIVGVGDYLTQVLTQKYGYNVLHHTESYDADSDAYSRALIGLEKVLEENPSIEVIIDLHRDEMKEGTKLVMDLDGRPTARFMFFNGLSRTKKTGDISYLYNENQEGNLAFSFQMQLMAAQFYPGLTRKIYLKGYRYNMHLKEKYLLVELGAQNNTVEEAKNACDPLAHILDLVLDN